MTITVHDILKTIDSAAPFARAESWDHVGLQVGCAEASVGTVLLAVDPSPPVIEEAVAAGADLLITHHPLFFHPVTQLTDDQPIGRAVARLHRANIAYVAAHTNLDNACPGTSDVLAEIIGVENLEVVGGHQDPSFKVVTFVPESHVDAVRNAMAEAGAGVIGAYSHCSFQVSGTGTFLPLEGAQPYSGRVGDLSREPELRLEMLVPTRCLDAVVAAMCRAHPYEEVAYDVYRLENAGTAYGCLRLGRLREPCDLVAFAEHVGEVLGLPAVRVVDAGRDAIRRVAVVAGSGMSLADRASKAGADLLVTGDVKHHDADRCRAIGLSVVDVGHFASERVALGLLRDILASRFPEGLRVVLSESDSDPLAWQPCSGKAEVGRSEDGGGVHLA